VMLPPCGAGALVGARGGTETTLFGSSVEMHAVRTETPMSMPIVRRIHWKGLVARP
jgi:hypothetical protein